MTKRHHQVNGSLEIGRYKQRYLNELSASEETWLTGALFVSDFQGSKLKKASPLPST